MYQIGNSSDIEPKCCEQLNFFQYFCDQIIGDFCSKPTISIKIALKKQKIPKISQKENRQVVKIKTTLELAESTKYAHS
jgi:hypothetical protein